MKKFRLNAITTRGDDDKKVMVDKGSDSGDSYCTIIIGENGTGKSTIMRDIALTLRSLTRGRNSARVGLKNTYASRVTWMNIAKPGDTSDIYIRAQNNRVAIVADANAEILLPSRIITISFSAFDKFPLNYDDGRSSLIDRAASRYVYLGQRNHGIRSSAVSRLFASLDAAIQKHLDQSAENRADIAFVLEAIGYRPEIKFYYELRNETLTIEDILSFINRRNTMHGKRYYIDEDDTKKIIDAFFHLEPQLYDGKIEISIDLNDSAPPGAADFFAARTLHKFDVAKISAVECFNRRVNDFVDITEASSGELNIISSFLGLAAAIDDGSLILIDEPENSLHPEWQLRYVEILTRVLRHFRGCHYIIATHSPIVASGAAKLPSRILSMDGLGIDFDVSKISGASPDAVLVNAFGSITRNNNYIRMLILEAIHFAETGDIDNERYQQIKAVFSAISPKMLNDDPLKPIVTSIAGQYVEAG